MPTRQALVAAAIVVIVPACSPGSTSTSEEPGVPSQQPKPALPEPGSTGTSSAGPLEIRIDDGKPSPPSKLFPLPPFEENMEDHAWAFGWTADGSAFAHCEIGAGANCDSCTFTRLDNTTELVLTSSNCDDPAPTGLSDQQLKQRLAERGVAMRDGEWAHGGELIVTARQVLGPPDNYDDSRAILEIGSARRDGSAEGTLLRLDGCTTNDDGLSCFTDAHADVILASPDGSSIAILTHFWEGEYSDTFQLSIVPAQAWVSDK